MINVSKPICYSPEETGCDSSGSEDPAFYTPYWGYAHLSTSHDDRHALHISMNGKLFANTPIDSSFSQRPALY